MGIVVTEAIVTCDKCEHSETIQSAKLPEGWTRVRKANNQMAILCAADTEALNTFFG